MARLIIETDSEDEFPELRVVCERARVKPKSKQEVDYTEWEKENTPPQQPSARKAVARTQKLAASSRAVTPLRRRKLGSAQTVDNLLLGKRLEGTSFGEIQDAGDVVDSKGLQETRLRSRHRIAHKQKVSTPRTETQLLGATNDLEGSSDNMSDFIVSDDFEDDNDESNLELRSRQLVEDVQPSSLRNTVSEATTTRSVAPRDEAPEKIVRSKRFRGGSAGATRDENTASTQESFVETYPKQCKALDTAAGLGEDLQKLRISEHDHDVRSDTALDVPPCTPKKKQGPASRTLSPAKLPNVPPSPWKPYQDEFWSQDLNDAWVDKHSPVKSVLETSQSFVQKELSQRYRTSPQKREEKKSFDNKKTALAQRFLEELDCVVTEGKLSEITNVTGGIKIVWSKTLNTTAGRAHWKCKETTTTSVLPDGTKVSTKNREHTAWIELAEKVIDSESNLLNTLAHEFCHVANYILSGNPQPAHGREFKAWGTRCMEAFRSRGIVVTTKHSYKIDYKYIWRCAELMCGKEYGRHSKSIDPTKARCGSCRGELEQVKPIPRGKGKGKSQPTEYQLFMQREMGILKRDRPSMPFKDMMPIIAKKWAERSQREQVTESKKAESNNEAGVEVQPILLEECDSDARAIEIQLLGGLSPAEKSLGESDIRELTDGIKGVDIDSLARRRSGLDE